MESDVRQRIIALFKAKKTNPTKFSKGDSALQKRLSRQLNSGASITFETLSSILEAFPEISAEWLLRGKGCMITPEQSPSVDIEALKAELNMLKGENNVLREQLGMDKKFGKSKSA